MNLDEGKILTTQEVTDLHGQIKSEIISKHLKNITQYGELSLRAIHIEGDLDIDGNLDFADEKLQVLVVDGDLNISGLLRDRFCEEIESLLFVKGNINTRNFFTFGSLEVHGNVNVEEHLMLIDNSCIAHIVGDLNARFGFNVYHFCKVDGKVSIDILLQNGGFIESKDDVNYTDSDDEKVAGILNHELIEGDEDEDEEFGFYVDYVPADGIAEWIIDGKSIFLKNTTMQKEA